LQAELEEIDIRTVELKKLVYEFKRDIVSAALNPRTGKIMAEKLVRYYEEQVKDKVPLSVDTLRHRSHQSPIIGRHY
jgi:hypothetical protein